MVYFTSPNKNKKQDVLMIYYYKIAHTNKISLEYGYVEKNKLRKAQKRVIDKEFESYSSSDRNSARHSSKMSG